MNTVPSTISNGLKVKVNLMEKLLLLSRAPNKPKMLLELRVKKSWVVLSGYALGPPHLRQVKGREDAAEDAKEDVREDVAAEDAKVAVDEKVEAEDVQANNDRERNPAVETIDLVALKLRERPPCF